ncbi:MAG: hypothetical protein ACTSW4_06820 [Candidatus Ranarchaeia archaeon]
MAVSGNSFWKVIVILLVGVAVVLGFFGVIFLIAAPIQQTQSRLVTGSLLSAAAIVIALGSIWTARAKVQVHYTVKAELDLPADFSLKGLQCKACGAPLSREMVSWNQETNSIMVHCKYCGVEYELVEEPRW